MQICPYCNGLKAVRLPCSVCGNELLDYGKTIDYVDSYSPYEEIDMEEDKDSQCIHILYCKICLQEFEIMLFTL
ncbi:hypothetical protein [Ectobacillus sp. sgz5001026]|uniref:hypothetical protein n=1 Tax=Ectobacillus sp. sgz5001026 TaxID=3242473 RepID=UPI0036D2D5DD